VRPPASGRDYGLRVTIYGFRRQVVCYVTRTTPAGEELIVFEHAYDDPARPSGVQVPAGTIQPFESMPDAAVREVTEETGLGGLTYIGELGAIELGPGDADGPSVRNFVRLAAPAADEPVEGERSRVWEHAVTGDGADAGMIFRCRWEALPLGLELAGDQGAFLDGLRSSA
jgi:8-oxo-dGTP pyrophosphatase MutT (NUDIX family)